VVPESRESLTTPPKSPPPRRSCQCPQLAWHCQWLQWRRGAASGRCGAAVEQHCSSGDSVRDCQPSGRLMSYQSSVSQAPPAGLAASGCQWPAGDSSSLSLLARRRVQLPVRFKRHTNKKCRQLGATCKCVQPLNIASSPFFIISLPYLAFGRPPGAPSFPPTFNGLFPLHPHTRHGWRPIRRPRRQRAARR
jgi:hypothetical protein